MKKVRYTVLKQIGEAMLENLSFYQKARLWLSDFSFMQKPLSWLDKIEEGLNQTTQQISLWWDNYGIYFRYILLLFAFTISYLFLKIIFKKIINWHRAALFDYADGARMRYWERYAMAEEKQALSSIQDVIAESKKYTLKKIEAKSLPVGFDLFYQIMRAMTQGYSDGEIVKILPSHFSLIDVVPMIEALRSFRDLAARQILQPRNRIKREYAKALQDLQNGNPYRAAQLMKKELMIAQKSLFDLKDRLLQQYARKEASQLALHLALILGVYDVNLSEKAFQRAMELNPKNSQSMILYGRFRQRLFGAQDKAMGKTFKQLSRGIDKTLQNYMLDYATEMVRKTEVRARLDELKLRYQDEKERYNAAVQVERLKVREALKMARMRSIANEANER